MMLTQWTLETFGHLDNVQTSVVAEEAQKEGWIAGNFWNVVAVPLDPLGGL